MGNGSWEWGLGNLGFGEWRLGNSSWGMEVGNGVGKWVLRNLGFREWRLGNRGCEMRGKQGNERGKQYKNNVQTIYKINKKNCLSLTNL